LLRARDWITLPVLVMADSTDAGAVNWLMKRASTALLLWSDYSDAPDALKKLIHPVQRHRTANLAQAASNSVCLFVDDSPTVRIAFKRLLAAEGYQVETAVSAEDGREKAMSQDFDIAIVDYFMPGDNGAMLVKQLRDTPKTSGILAAIITGTYSDRVITESLGAGAVECMFKSEARELFLARMRSLSRTVLDRKAIDNERRRLAGHPDLGGRRRLRRRLSRLHPVHQPGGAGHPRLRRTTGDFVGQNARRSLPLRVSKTAREFRARPASCRSATTTATRSPAGRPCSGTSPGARCRSNARSIRWTSTASAKAR
jgi:CheY-like chemotaxis protein